MIPRLITIIFGFLLLGSFPCAAEDAELVIDGVEGEALENVEQALALPRDLVRDGKVNRLWLQRLAGQADEKTRKALEPYGFYSSRATATVEREDETYMLHVRVVPGEPVRLRTVRVALRGQGEGEKRLNRLVRNFPLKSGDILLQRQYETAKENLRSRAQELGYLDADFPVHEIRITRSESAAEIDLEMETGPRYFFGAVRIEGALQYPDRFLRRYVAFQPGEPFSYAKLGETQINFANAERFRQVVVTPEREKAFENKVPVLVHLEPLPRHTLHPGIGYGTDTGARFSIRYRDLNVGQLGHEFNANFFISEVLQGLAAKYIIPGSHDLRNSTDIQLNLQREDVTTYTDSIAAIELAQNRTFGKGRLGTLYLRVQQEEFTVGNATSSSRMILPGARFVEERYDNLVRPRRGHRYLLDVRGTHQYLGSDTGLIQFIVDGSTLIPLAWRSSLFLRAKGALTAQNDPLAELPVSLRFFAGGEDSVRGYSYRSLGPRDFAGNVVGGRNLAVGSIELFRDLFRSFAVSAFYDAGNAFNSYSNIRLYQGTGVGVHYYSPIGAINLYLARQIGVSSPSFHIHFTLGFQL